MSRIGPNETTKGDVVVILTLFEVYHPSVILTLLAAILKKSKRKPERDLGEKIDKAMTECADEVRAEIKAQMQTKAEAEKAAAQGVEELKKELGL